MTRYPLYRGLDRTRGRSGRSALWTMSAALVRCTVVGCIIVGCITIRVFEGDFILSKLQTEVSVQIVSVSAIPVIV
jgi:hypothetical protein